MLTVQTGGKAQGSPSGSSKWPLRKTKGMYLADMVWLKLSAEFKYIFLNLIIDKYKNPQMFSIYLYL